MTKTTLTQKRKRGRPSNADRAQSAVLRAHVDHETVDPLAVLAALAVDPKTPAKIRLDAALALQKARDAKGTGSSRKITCGENPPPVPVDAVTKKALEIMNRNGAN